MTEVRVVRVFADGEGRFGNPLGVVLDTSGLDDDRRQAIAAELNFSETVFVEDVEQSELRIFTPATELPPVEGRERRSVLGAFTLVRDVGVLRQAQHALPARSARLRCIDFR